MALAAQQCGNHLEDSSLGPVRVGKHDEHLAGWQFIGHLLPLVLEWQQTRRHQGQVIDLCFPHLPQWSGHPGFHGVCMQPGYRFPDMDA